MTVSNQINKISYVGDGIETEFDFTFKAFIANDIKVYLDSVLQSSGVSVVLEVLPTEGGTAIFDVAPASDVVVTISRELSFTQDADYPVGGEFPSESHETQLDRNVMMIQQLNEEVSRGLTVPIESEGFQISGDVAALELLRINAAGDGIDSVVVGDVLSSDFQGMLSGLLVDDLLVYDSAAFVNKPQTEVFQPAIDKERAYFPHSEIQEDDDLPANHFVRVGKWNVAEMANGNIIHIGASRPAPTASLTAKNMLLHYFMSAADISKNVKIIVRAYEDSLVAGSDWSATTPIKTTTSDDVSVRDDTNHGILTLTDVIGAATLSADAELRYEIELAAATTNPHTGNLQVRAVEVING